LHESRKTKRTVLEALKPHGLKNVKDARAMGGSFEKYTGETPQGQSKLLKPHREPFRAHADYAASKIGSRLNPLTPKVKVVDFEGQTASEQDLLDTDKSFKLQK